VCMDVDEWVKLKKKKKGGGVGGMRRLDGDEEASVRACPWTKERKAWMLMAWTKR
jgi:hypothetical protein